MHEADFFYTHHRADWDANKASQHPRVFRTTCRQFLVRIWRQQYQRIEVPEPLALPLLPQLVAISIALKIKRIIRRNHIRSTLVFYAIENFDQVQKLKTKLPIPTGPLRCLLNMLLNVVLKETSRAAFGTQGALDTLRSQLGEKAWRHFASRADVQVIPGLPAASAAVSVKDQNLVCFLGSFELRKGIDKVLESWRPLSLNRPSSRLVIIGHGELADFVVRFCEQESIELWLDPPRETIRSILEHAHCLVLPSQRTSVWREQIGLPILEALETGCEIVTTDETGISDWLRAHDHQVLNPDVSAHALAVAIATALDANRPASSVTSALPAVDGRIAADHWLLAPLETDDEG